MTNFLKAVGILAIIGIVVISSLFVLDVVTASETREILQKVLLVLGILALGGVAASFVARSKA